MLHLNIPTMWMNDFTSINFFLILAIISVQFVSFRCVVQFEIAAVVFFKILSVVLFFNFTRPLPKISMTVYGPIQRGSILDPMRCIRLLFFTYTVDPTGISE